MYNRGIILLLWSLLALLNGCKDPNIPENRVFSINDLGHKRVGVQIGNTAEIYAADYGGDTAKIQLERFNSLDEAMQALRRGELDAVLCDDAPAAVFVGRYRSLRILEEVFMEEEYAGVVAKERFALLDTLNMALIQMRAMGVFDSIFASYIGGSGDYHFKPDSLNGPVIRVATNAEFPPYEFRTEKGFGGIDIEICHYISDFMERPLEIVDMPFDSILDAVRLGRADMGFAALSATEERRELVNFTDTYAKSKIVVVVRNNEEESLMTLIEDTLFGE